MATTGVLSAMPYRCPFLFSISRSAFEAARIALCKSAGLAPGSSGFLLLFLISLEAPLYAGDRLSTSFLAISCSRAQALIVVLQPIPDGISQSRNCSPSFSSGRFQAILS